METGCSIKVHKKWTGVAAIRKISGADVLSFWKKIRKTFGGVPPPPFVRLRVKRKLTPFSSAHHPVEVLRI